MKMLNTAGKITAPILGAVVALLVGVSALLALPESSSQITAAAVTESVADGSKDAAARGTRANDTGARVGAGDAPETGPAGGAHATTPAKRIGGGEASYYGAQFAGRKTANGERFNPSALTAAHRSLPFGSKVRVTNAANGRSVVVRVNDRGPYAHGRLIDVSRGAAERLGMIQSGTAQVKLELISQSWS